MMQVNVQELRNRLNEVFSLVAQLKQLLDEYEKCESALRGCNKAVKELEETILRILKGEVQDLHIELSSTMMLELRREAVCLPSHYYVHEDIVDIICVRDTPLGKLLIYTTYDAVLNPSEETIREIVQNKVKPDLQEQAIQELKELPGR